MKYTLKPTVLVIEDYEPLRTTLTKILEIEYDVIGAQCGVEALQQLNVIIPDLILLDILLPFPLDGFEVLNIIKKEAKLNAIPVILISSLLEEENITKGLESGAIDYIAKPFKINNLLLKVKNQIQLKQNLYKNISNSIAAQLSTAASAGFEIEFKQQFEAIVEKMIDESGSSIHTIAQEMAMSISTLERWVKKIYASTPKKYIIDKKLQKAELLLTQQMGSVKDIAYILGFNSVSYFCLCYRNKFGKSPKAHTKLKPTTALQTNFMIC